MISSMTGYGHGVFRMNDVEVTAEVRSLNNRFLDIVLKLPRCLANYEQRVRDMIGSHISRGRINLWVGLTSPEDKYQSLMLNKGLAAAYLRIANELSAELKIDGQIAISQILTLPDVILSGADETGDEFAWQLAEQAIVTALTELREMRNKEGQALCNDLETRIHNLEQLICTIEDLAKNRTLEEFDKLRQRAGKLIGYEKVDEGRLELELALIADRLDVTEECVRFHSHDKLFLEMLQAPESAGRKLNFLLQEMNREANTIGTKAYSSEISHIVVQIKDEVERIREQIQNIE
jgi:uncharacterized protein (TIGR00255 family)